MMGSISEYIDHTNLRQEANKADIENLCKEAIENNFIRYASNITLQSEIHNQIFFTEDKKMGNEYHTGEYYGSFLVKIW